MNPVMDGPPGGARPVGRGLARPVRRTALAGLLLAALPAVAQVPFATDDAGVTDAGRWHFELFLQNADLKRIDRPATSQTTLVATAATGLFGWLEIGVDAPWIQVSIEDAADVSGVGDLNLSFKARLRESTGGIWPAVAVTAAVEFPTGDKPKGLGSGVYDYSVNLVGDWPLPAESALRANFGVLFAGNDRTGVIGLRSDSEILSSGISFTRTLSPTWDVGLELHAAEARASVGGNRELSAQLGARYALNGKLQLASGVTRGWYLAPDWQLQVGAVVDL